MSPSLLAPVSLIENLECLCEATSPGKDISAQACRDVHDCCGDVHDDALRPPARPQPCWQVTHLPQQYSWDCGLACAAMALCALGHSAVLPELRAAAATTSVWTIDIAHLLARAGAAVTFCTTTIGVNSGYGNECYYMDALCHDERRVRELFMTAPATGIVLSQRSVPLCELARTVGGGTALAVLLVDLRKIDPWQAAADRAWNLTTGVTSATAYIGHYLLLVGYEGCLTTTGQQQQQHSEEQLELNQQQQQQMHVLGSQRLTPPCSNPSSGRPPPGAPSAPESVPEATVRSRDLGHFWAHDPALTHGPVRIPAALLESARKSFGTDEDVLILQQPGLGREPPILLGARAGLYTR